VLKSLAALLRYVKKGWSSIREIQSPSKMSGPEEISEHGKDCSLELFAPPTDALPDLVENVLDLQAFRTLLPLLLNDLEEFTANP
jgi:hypothetical protein